MPLPDIQIYFNPNENISSQDMYLVSNYAFQIHKTFASNFISQYACRFNGFVASFLNNSTPSPSITFSNGLILFVLPVTDPTYSTNGYSGAIYSNTVGPGGSGNSPWNTIGITPPGSGSRTDSIDITYQEQLGASGGIGSTDPRDIIDSGGVITENVGMNTRNISSYSFTYIPNSPTVQPSPASGSIRLATFTVTSAGLCTLTYLLPSIWENQIFPGTANTAEQSESLYDNLAAIRSQLNAIIGQSSWYQAPAISLQTLSAPFVKGENVIRNAGMSIAQRGTSGTVAKNTPTYTLDGWIVYQNNSGSDTVAWSQTLSPNGQNALKLIPSNTLTDLYVKQRIESVLMKNLGYQNITIQAYIYNGTSSTITPTLTLNVPTAQDNYTSTPTTVTGFPKGLQSILAGSGSTVSYTFALTNAYNFNYGMEVIFDFGASITGSNTLEISNVDVSATPTLAAGLSAIIPLAQIRPVQEQLVECQRYLQVWGPSSSQAAPYNSGAIIDNTHGTTLFPLLTTMRIAPTATLIDDEWDVIDYGAATSRPITGASFYAEVNVGGISFTYNNGEGSLTSGHPCAIQFGGTSDSITLTAEL